jgi:putative transposase
MRKPGSAESWEARRMIAANLFDQGKEPKEVAAIVGAAAQTVREWRRDYLKGGRAALASTRPTGRPRKLSDAQRQQLLTLLAQGPTAHGYADAHLWTTKLIARLIKAKFGVDHHHDHVGVLLHELRWSPQVPARRAKERDEARIAAWRDTLWPALLKKVPRRRARSSSATRSGS